MKGEKGTCVAGEVRRTKFDTQKNAQDACDFHIGMGFVHADYIVYKCTICDMWHFGKPEWALKYGKS